jgi:hypothetical protein
MLNQIIMVGENWTKAYKLECSQETADWSNPRADWSDPRPDWSDPRADWSDPRADWNDPRAPQKHSDKQNLSPGKLFIV